ncbi:hypothetical protein JXA56_02585 [Candidatus Micrarchaeota archaeon]|nr:hypothetical protein [Candidatus Micrarchaeota archaeon]
MTGGKIQKTRVVPRLSEIKKTFGHAGTLIAETIVYVEAKRRQGMAKLDRELKSDLGNVSVTADSAKSEAEEAKTAAQTAAKAAQNAQSSAEKAERSATEASSNASAMADDTKTATRQASEALEKAKSAENAAASAQDLVSQVLGALKIRIRMDGEEKMIEGGQTLQYLLKKMNEVLTAYSGIKKDISNLKSPGTSVDADALNARIDEIESDAVSALQAINERLEKFEGRIDEIENDAASALTTINERLNEMEGGDNE